MRMVEHRFSIPFCIFDEKMPDKVFRLLCFLFSISDFKGMCRPGYRAMRSGSDIGSDATVKRCLDYLRKNGWILVIKKGGSNNAVIILEIPSRLRKKDVPFKVYMARAPVLHSVKF